MADTLKDDHDALRAVMRRFATIMGAPGALDRTTLLAERLVFSRLLIRHLGVEQAAVAKMPPSAVTAHYATTLAGIRADYSAHVNHWTPARIHGDQTGYATAVRLLQARLCALMAWEEIALLPLIAGLAERRVA